MTCKNFFFFGTDDPTLTIHVPVHCGNNCSFCVNKNMYEGTKPTLESEIREAFLRVLEEMPEAAETVVISGGEPLYAFSWLEKYLLPTIEEYKKKGVIKHAYLNTFLPSSKIHNFTSLIVKYGIRDKNTNKFPYLDGISISRPNLDIESFRVTTLNDDELAAFMKTLNKHIPEKDRLDLRINALIDDSMTEEEIDEGVTLYSDMGFKVSLREDFTKETPTTLRKLTDTEKSKYDFLEPEYAVGCSGCATFVTNRDNVTIHKGLEHTSHTNIFPGENALIEVVDVIIDPQGRICYDWAITDEEKSKYELTYLSAHLPHIYSRNAMGMFIGKLPSCKSVSDEEEEKVDKDAIVDDIMHSFTSITDPISTVKRVSSTLIPKSETIISSCGLPNYSSCSM